MTRRIMSTAHEPAYSEDGLPKDRYRLYHLEKAKGGIALTMTAGSALIAGRPQEIATNPEGRFRLFRIGDAVAGRDIPAAIYDALRLCKDF